jgi:integrase/recombinase XerD
MEQERLDFIAYITSEKGLAQNTIAAYGHDTKLFVEFLKERGVAAFADVDLSHVTAFLKLLNKAGYASASLCRILITIKVLFRFLVREKAISENIALSLQSPKLWQLIPEVLSFDEIDSLLAQPDRKTPLGARDKAILEVLYASGLRVSEVCLLDIYSVDDTFVKVTGKGSKERIVPIGQQAVDAVDHYLLHYRCRTDSSKQLALFVSKSGKRIDRISIWKMIKNYAKRAGISKNIFPHTLRHSFATHLLDNGADLRVIQEMLGHASIASTDRYTHISQTKLQASFQTFHPRYD